MNKPHASAPKRHGRRSNLLRCLFIVFLVLFFSYLFFSDGSVSGLVGGLDWLGDGGLKPWILWRLNMKRLPSKVVRNGLRNRPKWEHLCYAVLWRDLWQESGDTRDFVHPHYLLGLVASSVVNKKVSLILVSANPVGFKGDLSLPTGYINVSFSRRHKKASGRK